MKYIGIGTFEGVEIRENKRMANVIGGWQVVIEFKVFINGKFKASFKKLEHAINSVCKSNEVDSIDIKDFDKFFKMEV